MKLPSMRMAIQDARDTFVRFPAIICNAILGTAVAVILVDHEGSGEPSILFSILFATILGIPLLFSLAVYAERKNVRWPRVLGFQAIGILLLVVYAATVPQDLTFAPTAVPGRFFLFGAALSFLMMFIPSANDTPEQTFWHFNWQFFLRVVMAGVYAGVLFTGFALALAALDNLFGVTIPGKRYPELWVAIVGLFAPWFTLAGTPDARPGVATDHPYPRGMKVFALYILGPIVLVYLVILYAYLIKVLIAWDWPKGWVSGLIFGFAGCGVLLVVLLKPLIEKEGMVWIRRAILWFHIVLAPLLVMLFLAIGRRVSEYGITEPRYIALTMAAWLGIIVLYFLLSRKNSLRFIPLSLCLMAFGISFGPWGLFAVSESSQRARLETLLTSAGILNNGRVTATHPPVPFEDVREISGILTYLRDAHGFESIQPWFETNLRIDTAVSRLRYKPAADIAEMMGITFVQPWEGARGGSVTLRANGGFPVTGYDRLARFSPYAGFNDRVDTLGGGVCIRSRDGINTLTFTGTDTSVQYLTVDLRGHAAAILQGYDRNVIKAVPDTIMMLRASGNGLDVCICPWSIDVWTKDDSTRITSMEAIVLFTTPERTP